MMNQKQVKHAIALHQRSLKQAMRAAKNLGWSEATIREVANLEWSERGLSRMAQSCRATRQQIAAITAVRDAAKFEMIGKFALGVK